MFVELYSRCATVLQQDGKTLRSSRTTVSQADSLVLQETVLSARTGRVATLISLIAALDVARTSSDRTVGPARTGMRCGGQDEE